MHQPVAATSAAADPSTIRSDRQIFFMADGPRSGREATRTETPADRSIEGPWDRSLSNGLDDDNTTVV